MVVCEGQLLHCFATRHINSWSMAQAYPGFQIIWNAIGKHNMPSEYMKKKKQNVTFISLNGADFYLHIVTHNVFKYVGMHYKITFVHPKTNSCHFIERKRIISINNAHIAQLPTLSSLPSLSLKMYLQFISGKRKFLQINFP